MKVEKFWNKAFLAALSRLPPEEAKEEADWATALCISYWQGRKYAWAHPKIGKWKDQDIADVPFGKCTDADVAEKLNAAFSPAAPDDDSPAD